MVFGDTPYEISAAIIASPITPAPITPTGIDFVIVQAYLLSV
jgi:hypothetical protein